VVYRRRHLRQGFTFVFDDRPEPAVRRLRLTEWEP